MAAHTWCRLKMPSDLLKKGLHFALTNVSHVRNRQSGTCRHVVSVLTPEEEEQKLAKLKGKAKLASVPSNNTNTGAVKSSQSSLSHISAFSRTVDHTTEEIVFSKNFKFTHIKESSDSRLGPAITRTKSRKRREKHREILLEGTRLITDALEGGAVLKTLYFSRLDTMKGLPLTKLDIPIYKVPHHFIKIWSDLITPPGIMGIFKMPNQGEISVERTDVMPLTLVCDSIQDPGNLGTIIRVAAAAGCEKILLTKGCVDIWETKVLRSGAGSHFRIPLLSNLEWDTLIAYFKPDSKVYLADVGHVTFDSSNDYKDHFGEETSQDTEMTREKKNPQEVNQTMINSESHGDISTDFSGKSLLKSLPSQIYHEVNYTGCSSVLIIGNESTGPSTKAKKAVLDHSGTSVKVPMVANVESLNNTVAAAIIMFEIRRQLMTKTS